MDETPEKASDPIEDAMAAAMAEAMGEAPVTPPGDVAEPASASIDDEMAAAMADAMGETPAKSSNATDSTSIEDEMAAAMAEAMGGETSDPSSLLSSAADAIKNVSDPPFEGAPSESAASSGAQAASPMASSYSRAVLAIETPVAVVLAKKKISIDGIVNIVPGSMLTFDAHCDEPLTLEAGGYPFALGETVKIGDKFGLRIRQLLHSED